MESIIAMMGMNDVMGISNRHLNEICNYMNKHGHGLIAKQDIIPIVLQTAAEKKTIAEIEDKESQSHIKHFVRAMNTPKQVFADFGVRRKRVVNPYETGVRKQIG